MSSREHVAWQLRLQLSRGASLPPPEKTLCVGQQHLLETIGGRQEKSPSAPSQPPEPVRLRPRAARGDVQRRSQVGGTPALSKWPRVDSGVLERERGRVGGEVSSGRRHRRPDRWLRSRRKGRRAAACRGPLGAGTGKALTSPRSLRKEHGPARTPTSGGETALGLTSRTQKYCVILGH